MDADEVVVGREQRDGMGMVFDLFGEGWSITKHP